MSQATATPSKKPSVLRPYFDITTVPFKNNHTHKEAWCLGCISSRVASILEDDRRAVTAGHRTGVRSEAELESVARLTAVGQPLCSNLDTLAVHARTCNDCVPEADRSRVLAERSAERQQNAIKRARPVLGNLTNAATAHSLGVPSQSVPFYATGMQILAGTPVPAQPALVTPPPFAAAQQAINSTPLPPLHRTDTVPQLPLPPNLSETQHEFAQDLCRVFVACNIPWNAASNPELKAFLAKWLPNLRLPDRRTLSGPLLRAEKEKAVQRVRSKVNDKMVMLQCDGWKNVARIPLVTFMMTVEQEAYLLQSHNMFGEPKTGDKLWQLTQRTVEFVRDVYGGTVIGACSDDGPDGKRMRRLARESIPWWIIVLCWAHQNQLIIADLIRRVPALKNLINRALLVIKWFMTHGTALSLLHEQQTRNPAIQRALMLLLPVVSRWGAYYFSLARLLRLEGSVRGVCYDHKTELLALRSQGDDDEGSTRAEDVIRIVGNEDFWMDLRQAKNHMEPLAISSLILQTPTLRLDQVLLTLGNLYRVYGAVGVDEDVSGAVLASLEKRWKAADQEVFILAVLFNPYIRDRAFRDTHLSRGELLQMCTRAYERFFRRDATEQFWSACQRYLDAENRFSEKRMSLSFHQDRAHRKREHVNLVLLWSAVQVKHAGNAEDAADHEVATLAIRLLSAVANSTACERNFSTFGIIHSKLRNSLRVESTHDINFVRMDINARHVEAGLKPQRLKRKHGTEDPSLSSSSSIASTLSSTQPSSDPPDEPVSSGLVSSDRASEAADIDELVNDALQANIPEPDATEFSTGSFTKIKLADVFLIPDDGEVAADSPLFSFWKGAIELLDDDEDVDETV